MDRPEIANDLLEALRADASGTLLREVLAELRKMERDVQARLRQLNDRASYQQLIAAKQAVTSALVVMEGLAAGSRRV